MKRQNFIRIRCLIKGWITVSIAHINSMDINDFSVRSIKMTSGEMYLFAAHEGKRIKNKLTNLGIYP